MDRRQAGFDDALGLKMLGDLGQRDVALITIHQGENERFVPIPASKPSACSAGQAPACRSNAKRDTMSQTSKSRSKTAVPLVRRGHNVDRQMKP